MISIRKLKENDQIFFTKLIFSEETYYEDFLKIGWSKDEISKQLSKSVNLSFGVFYRKSLISFILGDLFDIDKMSEYEILLIYVRNNFRNKGLGTKLIKKLEENNNCLKKIYLEVSVNNIQGISFYKKMNFKKIYTRKNYFLVKSKRVDAFVMSKNIKNEKK